MQIQNCGAAQERRSLLSAIEHDYIKHKNQYDAHYHPFLSKLWEKHRELSYY
jgi:hypothetical protein